MRPLQLRKFNDLYKSYGLGAVKNLHLIFQLLILGRTTNLWKLKDYVGTVLGNCEVQPESHYRRLIRFFDNWSDDEEFRLDLLKRAFKTLRRLRFTHLLLDGTSWKRGNCKYHYMVLSVLAGPVAIPIFWKQLNKIGASNQQERQDLLEQAMKHFDFTGMTLLADREYIGVNWFKLLKTKRLNFVIRLRFGDYYEAVDAVEGKTYQEMYDSCFAQGKFVRKCIDLGGLPYYLSMRYNPKGKPGEEVIIFLTLIRPVKKTVDQYVKRWRIECLFRHLKTNGFHLEEINLKSRARSDLMMTLVCCTYAITIRAACQCRTIIRRIQYADGTAFPAQSIFRRGLGLVTARCASLAHFINYLLYADGKPKLVIPKNV